MDAEAQLDAFIARYSDDVASLARQAIRVMRDRLPGAVIQVYDNYNALAVGFGSAAGMKGLVFSIAVYPRWVSLFFAWGAGLDDPHGLLRGKGGQVRHIVLTSLDLLDDPRVLDLMDRALAERPIDPSRPSTLVIKSVSARQRPRRPA